MEFHYWQCYGPFAMEFVVAIVVGMVVERMMTRDHFRRSCSRASKPWTILGLRWIGTCTSRQLVGRTLGVQLHRW